MECFCACLGGGGDVQLAIMVTLLTTFGNEEPDLWKAVERGTYFGV
jgi:hypothetical protein